MGTELKHGKMEANLKEIMLIRKNKDMENIPGLIDLLTLGIGITMKRMEKDN